MSLELDQDQQLAYGRFRIGKNLLVTGAGGVGKSFLLAAITKFCKENYIKYGLTAMTGVAASLISGTTLHSWAGIGLGKDPVEVLINKIMGKFLLAKKWRETRLLIIDEVSMLSLELLDKLNIIAKSVRKNTRPFGGMQVIFTGDFCQLPPVLGEFAFKSLTWHEMNIEMIHLTIQHRQDPDEISFRKTLNNVRIGIIDDEGIQLLKSRETLPEHTCLYNDPNIDLYEIKPTILYPHCASVESINIGKIIKLPGDLKSYNAKDIMFTNADDERNNRSMTIPEKYKFLTNFKSPECVDVKVGAQIMCVRNLTGSGLVNGSRGVVIKMNEKSIQIKWAIGPTVYDELPYIEERIEVDQFIFVRVQIPIILAWALTVHKIQGSTLDCVTADLRQAFEYGQVYVALSRVKSLTGLTLLGFDPTKIKCHPEVLQYYGYIQNNPLDPKLISDFSSIRIPDIASQIILPK
jgi:ATP-dependent DNA helicase PIF1